jgi:hypothetical protein
MSELLPRPERAATQARLSPAHEAAIAAGALLLSLALFFWPALFGGRVLSPADLIFDLDPLWQRLAPAGYTQPSNHVLSDQVTQFWPWRVFAVRSLERGELPLWNPYINGGQPFLASAQSALFDPLEAITYLVDVLYKPPLYAATVIVAISRLFVAGLFTFLFAREIGLTLPGALLAMFAFALSGPLVGWVGYPLASVMAWFPAMLWTIERAMARQSAGYTLLCGLVIGAQFLGGHPETSFVVAAAWAAYVLCRILGDRDRTVKARLAMGGRAVSAASIGAALGAIQLLPFIDALAQSAIVSSRQAQSAARSTTILARALFEWHEWPTLITAILPQFFGTPLDESYLYPYSNYIEQNAYAGVVPLVLALVAAVMAFRRRVSFHQQQARFWVLTAGISLGMALRLPVVNGLNYLPLFDISANGRYRLIYVFSIALLAGMGLDRLNRDRRASQRLVSRTWIAVVLSSLLLIAVAYGGAIIFRDRIIALGQDFVESRWGTPYFELPLEHYDALVQIKYDRWLARLLPTNAVMYLPVLLALCWFFLQRISPRRQAWAALGLTIADAFLLGMPFNPTTAPQDFFPKPDAIRFLQQDESLYRVCATGLILYPNSSTIFGLFDVRGYETVVPGRYVDLIDRLQGHFRYRTNSLFSEIESPLLDLLNVKYVLTDQELDPPWEHVYEDASSVRIYQNRSVMPRAFLLYRAEIVPSAEQSLARILDRDFDYRTIVLLEETPPDWTPPAQLPDRSPVVRVAVYEPDRIRIEVETAADGVLVLADSYMKGWKAYRDGKKVPLYAADHAFRAVVVPEGTHQIEFVYRPLSVEVGAALSAAALIALAGWAIYLGRQGRAR